MAEDQELKIYCPLIDSALVVYKKQLEDIYQRPVLVEELLSVVGNDIQAPKFLRIYCIEQISHIKY